MRYLAQLGSIDSSVTQVVEATPLALLMILSLPLKQLSLNLSISLFSASISSSRSSNANKLVFWLACVCSKRFFSILRISTSWLSTLDQRAAVVFVLINKPSLDWLCFSTIRSCWWGGARSWIARRMSKSRGRD